MTKSRRVLLLILVLLSTVLPATAQESHLTLQPANRFEAFPGPTMLEAFRRAYPDVVFESMWDTLVSDWRITLTYEGRTTELYWCDSRLIPFDKLTDKDKYDPLLYDYPYEVPDPSTFTQERINGILENSSRSVRKTSYGEAQFFYDFIYDTSTRGRADSHIVKMTFLGKQSNLHEKIRVPLAELEADLMQLAEADSEVKAFLGTIERCDGFNWRVIADSGNKSSHSLGISIDILPAGWGQKNLYWQWRRDIVGDAWVRTPLSRRWLLPDKVIQVFEKHGFIYGGKWDIWDNMHVEYKPELLEYRSLLE